nr:hypothetical protein [Tanacetum cinerariifolium]
MRRVGKGFSGVKTPLFEGMLAARQLAEEGIAEEQVQADDAVQENVAKDGAEFPTHIQQVLDVCFALTRRVENLKHDKAAQKLEIIKLKARVKRLERANKGRIINDLDKYEGIELVVDQVKDANLVEIEGRHAENQAEIYHLDLDHSFKVLSMQEDDSEIQEVVEVVTTAKLITDVVTAASQVSAASATISASKQSIPAAAPTIVLILLVERRYPLSRFTMKQLVNVTRLQVEEESEMSLELLSKYKTAQELWAAILKTFGGNEATKKTKKNILKQQYGNFKAEGSETLEQTFNRQQVIVSQLEFMDIEIEKDDLNQKFLTSLAPEWLMHTIVWRNKSDLDTMSLDDLYNHLKVYVFEVQKKSESNSQNMAFISSAKHSSGNEEVYTASVSTASTNVSPASANIKAASISQETAYVAGFDKSKVECFNCHKMGHFARECRAPKSQDRGRRENFRQGSKVEEQTPKALMAIDGAGWDWSFMGNKQEDHALVADEEVPTEFALMAKTSGES